MQANTKETHRDAAYQVAEVGSRSHGSNRTAEAGGEGFDRPVYSDKRIRAHRGSGQGRRQQLPTAESRQVGNRFIRQGQGNRLPSLGGSEHQVLPHRHTPFLKLEPRSFGGGVLAF